MMPIFQHYKDDYESFRLFTSQLVDNGNCKQMEIVRCFGVSKESVKRWVKKCKGQKRLRDFAQKKTNNRILTDDLKAEIQYHHAQGKDTNEIAKAVDVKVDTLKKAIRQGRIILPIVPTPSNTGSTHTKTERSVIDDQSGMGKACTFTLERVLAATVGETAAVSFSEQVDVHCAGVFISLPALIANGLLRHILIKG